MLDTMTSRRMIEVFSGGCYMCQEAISLIQELAGDSADIKVRDVRKPLHKTVADRYSVKRLPAVAIDGKLTDCSIGMTAKDLRAVGIASSSLRQVKNAMARFAGRTG